MSRKYVLRTGTHNQIDSASLFAAGVVDNSAIANDAITALKIEDGAVEASKLDVDAVTTLAIQNGAVTPAKAALTDTWDFSGGALQVATPTTSTEAANKQYVDSIALGLQPKEGVRALLEGADLTEIDFTYNGGAQTLTCNVNGSINDFGLDGLNDFALNDRLLVRFTVSDRQRAGIYTITQLGDAGNPVVLTRAADFNSSAEAKPGTVVVVRDGTAYGGTLWFLDNGAVTLDTTNLSWAQISSAADITAGVGLSKTGNTLDVQIDNSTVEINTNALRVKAGGIHNTHLADNAVDPNKLDPSCAGNGLDGGGGSALTVLPKPGGVVVVDGSGVDVQYASLSQDGILTDVDYGKLDALANNSARGTSSTSGTGTYDVSLPVVGINQTVLVKVTVISRSTTDSTKRCVQCVKFVLSRGGSGNSSQVGDTNVSDLFADAAGIGETSVAPLIGTNGADAVRVTGTLGHDIDHSVKVLTEVL